MSTQPTARPRRARHWLDNALAVLVVGLFALGAVVVLSGSYQIRPVLSGSMEPGLPVGGVVVTERVPVSVLRVRDVVVIHRPDQPDALVVHRIISLTPSDAGPVIETQGDANPAADGWQVSLRGDTAYRAVFALPLIGYVAVWAHGADGRVVLMVGGLLLIAAAAAGALVLSASSRRQSRAGSAGPDEPQSSAPSTEGTAAVTVDSGPAEARPIPPLPDPDDAACFDRVNPVGRPG